MNKPTLLVIIGDSLLPITNGGRLRIYNLTINLLKNWNIDIICLKPEEEEYQNQIKTIFRNVYFVERFSLNTNRQKESYLKKIKHLFLPPKNLYALPVNYLPQFNYLIQHQISIQSYKAILVFGASTFGFYLSNLQQNNIICDAGDALSLYIKSIASAKMIGGREWLSLYYAYLYNLRWEKKYLAKCKKIIAISERDKKWLSKTIAKSNIYVVENGVNTDYFTPQVAQPGIAKGLIIFTGVMGYEPNHDAMIYCLKKIWPLIKKKAPEAKLKIVGRYPKLELINLAQKQKDVEVTGEVEDIQKAVKGAQVFLCPMRIGAGMKNKILEALAMGIPVVTTSEGATGIEFEHGKVGYIADTPESLTHYTVSLLTERNKWEKLSKAARRLVTEKYSWQAKAEKLSKILLGG